MTFGNSWIKIGIVAQIKEWNFRKQKDDYVGWIRSFGAKEYCAISINRKDEFAETSKINSN